MSAPKIVEHKIVGMRKPNGSTQYIITLPKEYAETLKKKGIDSLFLIFNYSLCAFPKHGQLNEQVLITFLQKDSELQELFTETAHQKQPLQGK
ncbi:MAG: hypothetical protein ACPLW8_06855 [Candidatus Bathyarchaeales archaeon]